MDIYFVSVSLKVYVCNDVFEAWQKNSIKLQHGVKNLFISTQRVEMREDRPVNALHTCIELFVTQKVLKGVPKF